MSKIAVTKEQQQVKLLEAKLTQANREVQQLELKVRAMHQQHEDLQAKNATILKQSYQQQGALRDKDKNEEHARAMGADLAVARSHVEAAKGTIKALQMEREHLIARYNDDQQQWERLAAEFGEKEDEFRAEMARAQEAIEDKEHVLAQQRTETLRHQQEAAEERRRIARLAAELEAEQSKAAKLEAALEDLTSEVSEMGMRLSETTSQLTEQLELTRRERNETQSLRDKCDALSRRADQLADEGARKDATIADLRTAMLKGKGAVDDRDEAMRVAKAEMGRLQTEIDRLSKLNEQRAALAARNDALLSDATAKLRAAEDEALGLKERLRASELERMTAKDEAYKASNDAKQLGADMAILKASLESRDGSAKALNDKIAALEKELSTEKGLLAVANTRAETLVTLHASQIEAKSAEIARLKAEVASQLEHIDKVKAKHSTADEDRVVLSNTISELKTLLTAETSSGRALQEKLEASEAALAAETKVRVDAQAQLVFSRNEKATLESEISTVTNARDTLHGRLQACEDMLRAEQAKNRTAGSEAIALGVRIERLEAECDGLRGTLEDTVAAKEAETKALADERDRLRAKGGRIASENTELNAAARAYRDRARALEKSLKTAEEANRRLTRECTAVNGRKEEYKQLARSLADRRDRESDFSGRLAAFHKRQIAALRENSAVVRKHLDGFIQFQKMVATAVEMAQSRMEDFVGEDVWGDVLAIQKSAEEEKARAAAESAELQAQYEALKAEYQMSTAAAAASNNANANNAINTTASAVGGAKGTTAVDDGENGSDKENRHGVAGKLAEMTTISPQRGHIALPSNATGRDDRQRLEASDDEGGEYAGNAVYGGGSSRSGRDVSASVRPPTRSMQQAAEMANQQTASQSAPRSLAVDRSAANGAATASSVSPAASARIDTARSAAVAPQRSAAPSLGVDEHCGVGDYDEAALMAMDTSPRALKRHRTEAADGGDGYGIGGAAAVLKLESVEPAVPSRSPAPITPRVSPSRGAAIASSGF